MTEEVPLRGAGDRRGRGSERNLAAALKLMRQALEILDENDAPPEIGAHLDLAIHRLEEATGGNPSTD